MTTLLRTLTVANAAWREATRWRHPDIDVDHAFLGLIAAGGPAAALLGDARTRRWGLAGTAAGVLSRLLARTTERGGRRHPDAPDRLAGDLLDAAAHPASILAFGALTASSIRARRSGRASWKARTLP